ncbi:hypothetical protein C8J57DRAFT_1220479 [Mycena rebaudengoi]|nr:hypothetical protein C8J57DRAFT_1220479 [Mycena rebaudengoi]
MPAGNRRHIPREKKQLLVVMANYLKTPEEIAANVAVLGSKIENVYRFRFSLHSQEHRDERAGAAAPQGAPQAQEERKDEAQALLLGPAHPEEGCWKLLLLVPPAPRGPSRDNLLSNSDKENEYEWQEYLHICTFITDHFLRRTNSSPQNNMHAGD